MKRLAIFLVLALCQTASAQCLNGMCGVPASVAQVAVNDTPAYAWEAYTDSQHVLKKDGVVIGQWYDHHYYPWDGVKNGPAGKPPIDPPDTAKAATESWRCSGVNPANVHGHDKESVTFCGKALHPGRMAEAMAGGLTDDSSKGHFVVIAKNEAARAEVLAAWGRLPTEFTSRYNVWAAAPDHFSMLDRFAGKPRFFAEGDPTVVLQKPNGEVLFRRPQANQAFKSSDIQDLMKSDPDYKPALDPGAPAPVSKAFSLSKPEVISAACVVLALAIPVSRFLRRKV